MDWKSENHCAQKARIASLILTSIVLLGEWWSRWQQQQQPRYCLELLLKLPTFKKMKAIKLQSPLGSPNLATQHPLKPVLKVSQTLCLNSLHLSVRQEILSKARKMLTWLRIVCIIIGRVLRFSEFAGPERWRHVMMADAGCLVRGIRCLNIPF